MIPIFNSFVLIFNSFRDRFIVLEGRIKYSKIQVHVDSAFHRKPSNLKHLSSEVRNHLT